MVNDLTIIAISSNREKEEFEQKTRSKLLEASGDYPIISVTQKPMDLGRNICVGDVGSTYRNAYMQLLIGCREAKTEYISIAEADQLYPPGYFDVKLEPLADDEFCYMYKDLYVLFLRETAIGKYRFWKKDFGDWCIIINRERFIKRLLSCLGHREEWGSGKMLSTVRHKKFKRFDAGAPIITVKTYDNINRNTGIMGDVRPVGSLPHWGSAEELSKYLGL